MKTYTPPGPIPAPLSTVKSGTKFVADTPFNGTAAIVLLHMAKKLRLFFNKFLDVPEISCFRGFIQKIYSAHRDSIFTGVI